ncbi:MAG TPA: hypothetical protein VHL53_11245 [Acidimicrobiia bacterium]|nr:hypothetical protein [Acidimicrobiia bacterium]
MSGPAEGRPASPTRAERPLLEAPPVAEAPPVVEPAPGPAAAGPRVLRRRRTIDLRHPEVVRYERMIGALRLLLRVAFVTALAGLLLPDPAGDVAAAVAVVIVVAAPLVRVGWLAIRWYRRGDRRFAAVAVALLLVVAIGSVLAIVTR